MWTTLIQAPDLDAVLSLLAKTVYGPFLQLPRQELTARRIVYQIRQHLAAVYERVIGIAPEPGRALLLRMWQLYEVDNLKATLRGIETGASWDQVRHLLNPMRRYVSLSMADMERMIQSGSIPRAIEVIRDTPYYDTLSHALERYRVEKNLFPLEVALDLEYRRSLWDSIDRLKGTDRAQALRILGTVLDVDNLLWAIRYRLYHHLSEEEIINYTLAVGYQVRDEDIRAIATGADIGRVVRRIYSEVEGIESMAAQPKLDLIALEVLLQRHIIRQCRAAFVGYPFHIGIPVAYLLLQEYEIRDLTLLVEAKSSQLPPEAFVSMLELQPPVYQD